MGGAGASLAALAALALPLGTLPLFGSLRGGLFGGGLLDHGLRLHKRDEAAKLLRHVLPQHFWDDDPAAGLEVAHLEALEDTADHPGRRTERAVEHVHVLCLVVRGVHLVVAAELDLQMAKRGREASGDERPGAGLGAGDGGGGGGVTVAVAVVVVVVAAVAVVATVLCVCVCVCVSVKIVRGVLTSRLRDW